MAELHVQRKNRNSWWLWLVIGIVIIGIILLFSGQREDRLRDDGPTQQGQEPGRNVPADRPGPTSQVYFTNSEDPVMLASLN
jgi:hypothetical protein